MKRKIYVNLSLLSIITIFLTSILTLLICYHQFSNQIKSDSKNEATIISLELNRENDDVNYLSSFAYNNPRRITLIASNGKVLFDNFADAAQMQNHNTRPEIISARKTGTGESLRHSDTLKEDTYYFAVLLKNGDILRVASTTDSIYSIFISIIPIVFTIILVILILALYIAKKLTDNIIKPINKIDIDNLSSGNIYNELLPFIKRITDQNKKIQTQLEQIQSQNLRLTTISENMNEGLIVLDGDSIVLSINKSALKIFELHENDVLHKNFLHLTRKLDIIEHIKAALDGKKGTDTVSIGSHTFELYYSPVFKNSTVCGAILLFFDISEKAKAEQIRREFSANVSHELKTPITSILGYAQMINNGMAKQNDIKSFTIKIENEAERLIALIEDIIKLSKLDEQDAINDIQKVNILEISKYVVQSLENRIKDKKLSISIDGNDSFVDGNKSMLEELIYNLCDNAVKYNKTDGSINITVSNNKFEISDSGIGIAKENQDRIFERFYQVDSSRSKTVSGTGLGLSIVKHIALFHNAEISVESELDKGTKIIVEFRDKADA